MCRLYPNYFHSLNDSTFFAMFTKRQENEPDVEHFFKSVLFNHFFKLYNTEKNYHYRNIRDAVFKVTTSTNIDF